MSRGHKQQDGVFAIISVHLEEIDGKISSGSCSTEREREKSPSAASCENCQALLEKARQQHQIWVYVQQVAAEMLRSHAGAENPAAG